MKKDLLQRIKLPGGVEARQEGELLIIKSSGKEQARKIDQRITTKIDGRDIVIECKKATKKEKKIMNTLISHIKNMIRGFEKGFVYKLQVCSTHFPITVSIDKEKKELLVKNFLGESAPRKARILDNVEVKIEKDIITLESNSREAAGQTAANIEKATKIKKRDRRIFQDGIWIISKPTLKTRELQ